MTENKKIKNLLTFVLGAGFIIWTIIYGELSLAVVFGRFFVTSFFEINIENKRYKLFSYIVVDLLTILTLIYLSFISITGLFALIILLVFVARDIVNFVKDRVYSEEKKKRQAKRKKIIQYYFAIVFFIGIIGINIIGIYQNQDSFQRLINVIAITLSLVVLFFGVKNRKYLR